MKERQLPKHKDNVNNTVDDRERRTVQRCAICPPNKGENATRKARHGKGKARYKTKRKGR